jgi:tellurite resistance protein
MATGEDMVRWARGEQTVQFLVGRNRLEGFEAEDLAALTETLIGRADLRVETTATAALAVVTWMARSLLRTTVTG